MQDYEEMFGGADAAADPGYHDQQDQLKNDQDQDIGVIVRKRIHEERAK